MLPDDEVRGRRDPQQDGRVGDVGADDAMRAQPEAEDQADRDQRARAGRGDAEHEADRAAERDGGDLVPRLHPERLALARGVVGQRQRAQEHEARR